MADSSNYQRLFQLTVYSKLWSNFSHPTVSVLKMAAQIKIPLRNKVIVQEMKRLVSIE